MIGTSLPWLEAAIGVALIASAFVHSLRVPAGLAGLTLLIAFVLGQLLMLAGKRKATCGCFSAAAGVSPTTAARAGVLATLVLTSLVAASNPLGS